jgi:CO/xanthine dehydrogenase Mo-binding subunit
MSSPEINPPEVSALATSPVAGPPLGISLPNAFAVVGQRLPRLDAPAKVTGSQIYGADFALPGMLHGRLFRSTVPHALIRGINLQAARAIPGVRAVITATDIPPTRYGPAVKDMPVLASRRVRYIGEPVVAVAATSAEIADRAVAAIEAEYEALPALFDPEQALVQAEPQLHPDWETYAALPVLKRDGNVASHSRIIHGDVEAAFADCFKVYEHRFTTPVVHAGYTEPRAATARWEGDGSLTVWSNGQLPYEVQATLADILQMPISRIRVVIPGVGGGFGGKLRIGLEHYAALLARAAGRAVRMISTCEEELTTAPARQPSIVTLRTGVSRDGLLMAKQARVVLDCGAYAGSGAGTAAVALQIVAGPYRTPNLLLDGFAVYTNKLPTGSFRATAGPMGNFAVESQMDIIADDLGIDPLELRLRNVVRDGDTGPSGEPLSAVSVEECLRKAAQAIGWDQRRSRRGRGKGIACGWWMTTGGSSGVYVKLNADGTATLSSGAVELGTGALTGACQVLAEELGLPLDAIRLSAVDTEGVPYDYGAQGSRTAFSVGNAARDAAASLRQRIVAFAADRFGCAEERVSLQDGHAIAGINRLAIAEVARLIQLSGGGLIAHGTFINPAPPHDPARVRNHPLPAWNTPSFHAHAAEVTVDTETGEITVERYVVAQDVGFAINPAGIEGQIEGGVAQGLGQALSEEIVFNDGRVANPNLTDYKMPTSMDVPRIESILVECASSAGPFGAKGVGEPPCIEPLATIANAVASATCVRLTAVPITPERLLRAMREHGSDGLSAPAAAVGPA